MSDDFSGPPLALGTVTGLRCWDLSGSDTSVLRSLTQHYTWKDGVNVATCAYSWRDHNRVGDPDCTCGFYAYHDGSLHFGGMVAGVIEGFGRVTVGTRGFRCEKARIKAICIPKANRLRIHDYAIAMVLGVQFINLGYVLVDLGTWTKTLISLIICGILFVATFAGFQKWRRSRKDECVRRGYRERLAKTYPSAEVFTSFNKMIRAYPADVQGIVKVRKKTFRRYTAQLLIGDELWRLPKV